MQYPSLTASVISRILRMMWGGMCAILAMEVCGDHVIVSLGLVIIFLRGICVGAAAVLDVELSASPASRRKS